MMVNQQQHLMLMCSLARTSVRSKKTALIVSHSNSRFLMQEKSSISTTPEPHLEKWSQSSNLYHAHLILIHTLAPPQVHKIGTHSHMLWKSMVESNLSTQLMRLIFQMELLSHKVRPRLRLRATFSRLTPLRLTMWSNCIFRAKTSLCQQPA